MNGDPVREGPLDQPRRLRAGDVVLLGNDNTAKLLLLDEQKSTVLYRDRVLFKCKRFAVIRKVIGESTLRGTVSCFCF